MFTGIVEETGVVQKLDRKANLARLYVSAGKTLKRTKPGDSIAVDGVCLTVTSIKGKVFSFDVMQETILKTTLKFLRPKDQVNLERAITPMTRVSGHFVTGHIDDIGIIKNKITKPNLIKLEIQIRKSLMKYIAPKGSIAIDGISLTVAGVKKDSFSVYLIPFTNQVTTIASKKQGGRVNIETDILAKYVCRNFD